MVIFGGGYGVERLAEVAWLADKEIIYWGDIDTHGYAILDRLLAFLRQVRSMLMDLPTLQSHVQLWWREIPHQRYLGELTRLRGEEQAMFQLLRNNSLGEAVRMEQARLGFGFVNAAISAALHHKQE